MAQNFTQIQTGFDTALQTLLNSTTINGVNPIILYPENETINFAMLPDITSKLGVRTSLIPAKTIVETLGYNGYVSVNGIYAIDIMGVVNQGYTAVQELADIILGLFARSYQLTLNDGDVITVNTSSPAPNSSQGAWNMNKLYARQIIVEWFGFTQP
jgi:hypothetical protein